MEKPDTSMHPAELGGLDAAQPSLYPRRVLLAVSGLSPQIVTETLYALATDARHGPFVPTEIHLITTREGAQQATLSLLSKEPGWFSRLCKDYALQGVAFDSSHIHVIKDSAGREIDDIRTEADNRAAADCITSHVRQLSADKSCALHVSIAGGRKTMGFFLGYALSLYGRPQDRLSHVLVSAPFEGNRGFFYPTPASAVVNIGDKKYADASQAKVMLADIPYVSLRAGLTDAFLSGNAGFGETVDAARRALAPPKLTLHLRQRSITAGGVNVPLAPAELALLAVFARRKLRGEGPIQAPPKGVRDTDWHAWYQAEYDRIVGSRGAADMVAGGQAFQQGMGGEEFSERKSKLERRLKKALGPAVDPYLIDNGACRPGQYSLKLPASAIFIG